MSKDKVGILDSAEVRALEVKLEEATRSSESGVHRFTEPAAGTLTRATSRSHHLIFGRRGSGKSSLLRKAAQDLTVDRRPIAFVDLESFKGHEYPDVLISVLIETFNRFATWLETAAIAPASQTTFWSRLFGQKPTRPPFDRAQAGALSSSLRTELSHLRELLFSEDKAEIETTTAGKATDATAATAKATFGNDLAGASVAKHTSTASEIATERRSRFTRNKINHLHRGILDYQGLF